MSPVRCVVIGYASLDFKYATEPFEGPGRTTLIRRPLHRPGGDPGAVAYFARGLVRNGIPTDVVTWVGSDEHGDVFREHHRLSGVGVGGIVASGSRSPTTRIFWPGGGEPVMFFDPGELDQSLTAAQRALLGDARAVIVAVGPTEATAEALSVVAADAKVMWVVKADPRSVTPELSARLADRADVICHSGSETEFLHRTCGLDVSKLVAGGRLVVETRGAQGAVLRKPDGDIVLRPPEPVSAEDTTGAGDTFAAGLMARLLHDIEVTEAVQGGCADACALLRSRTNRGDDA
ncbi:carbohydrate kinase family protein [Thermocrispum sp.]|uniref:Carbohydrate kinase family protein n=1 Tax=Thermocrispum agreste TaxID=37925 RepID=A0A2W4JHG7_9PSEU|nr:carbohydrate kinase family protein [Thermocrispum sp.]PZM97405.1 MAG: hypothetical protein DIU77_09340 [Thermocrispum agreste]